MLDVRPILAGKRQCNVVRLGCLDHLAQDVVRRFAILDRPVRSRKLPVGELEAVQRVQHTVAWKPAGFEEAECDPPFLNSDGTQVPDADHVFARGRPG